jgi:Uma2 family endonuclease
MSTAELPKLITLEEFLALPDDDMDRELIHGEVRERPMTKRNRFHASAEATLARLIGNWVAEQSAPRGKVYSGEVGCILQRNPDSTVGIDVAYYSAETVARQSNATTMIDGAPILAVEVLSPSDKLEEIAEKISLYLHANVQLVWIVDPHFKTVTIHQNGAEPELVNINQQLTAEPHLPGLLIQVSELFG